jgi:3-deoxy-D-manno-octulosonic-acid transferase
VTPLSLSFYGLASGLLEPLAPALLRARARRGKEVAARLPERLGRASQARPEAPLVWFHGVSVGESLSLLPLIQAIARQRPDLALLITTGTGTAAALMAERKPAGAIHQFIPVDGPAAVGRFLDHWRPHLGVFVESELWPNLIAAAKRRGVRLALVSARMTDATARGWARAPGAAHALLASFDLILPQDAETESRLRALGAEAGPALNLKLVGEPLPCDAAELETLRNAVGARRVVLAASTHPSEEASIGRAFQAATAEGPPALLIVAPRHPDRGLPAAADLARLGFNVARRGSGAPLTGETTAYVADTLGELGLFLRLADVAVMGGAFAEGIGGHNPLEPARLGVPVVTGPHAFNARQIYDDLLAEAAAIQASDEAELARHIAGLLTYPHIARRMGAAAEAYAARQGAALERALDLLAPLAPP